MSERASIIQTVHASYICCHLTTYVCGVLWASAVLMFHALDYCIVSKDVKTLVRMSNARALLCWLLQLVTVF